MNIELNRCSIDDLLDYINDSSGEFGIHKTKFGEVPLQKDVSNNIEDYLKYSLSINIEKIKPIGIIFLKEIFDKTLELSIIIKEEYRKKHVLINLLKLNDKFILNTGVGFLNSLLKSLGKSSIITSVTESSPLESILLILGFKLKDKSSTNNKVLYSLS